MKAAPAKSQSTLAVHGFTLIEVLVSLVVLSIGLLGLAALQLSSLQLNTNSYFRTQATVAAYDLIDRIRSNRAAFIAGEYNVATHAAAGTKISNYGGCSSGGACDCENAVCTSANLALYDLGKWYEMTDGLLPQSQADRPTIVRDAATNEVTIVIKWMEKDVAQTKSWTVRL